jgi:hypothetical protein
MEIKRMRKEVEILEAEKQMVHLRQELEKTEHLLLKIRSQTQVIRRELMWVKQEEAIAKRRAARDLGLPHLSLGML